MSSAVGLRDYLGRGHHDDGREGIVLTKLAAGDLVKVPTGIGGGGTTRNVGSGTASKQANLEFNPDGSGTGVNMSVPAGLGNSASYTEVVYGSVVGIRWRRNSAASLAPIGVVIDGVAYSVRNAKVRYDSVAVSATDSEAMWIVADDLDPKVPHTVTVICYADPYGSSARALLFYGWLLEKSRGYKEPPRWGPLKTAATLNTTTTGLSDGIVYRKLMFHNTDANTRLVTFKQGANTVRVLSLAAGQSGEIDFGVPVVGSSGYTLQADAAGVVNWMPILAEVR